MKCEEIYNQFYHKDPEALSFCPYRISPLGAHIDHQNGIINGFAIDKGIYIAYSVKHNGVVELQSVNFDKRAQFHVASVPEFKVGDWADHLRGATKVLGERYMLKNGISAVIEGTLPIGGLSSSASVIIAFLTALAKANGITLEEWETIMMAKEAENRYVGVNCGKLDQSCEILCKNNSLLYLDCEDDSYDIIKKNPSMKPFKIGVFFSGLDRSLSNSKYNLRQDECKAAAYSLMAHAGLEYGKFEDARLRDVPRAVYEEYKDKLPLNFRKRAEHFYTEMERVDKGIKAWKEGDLDSYGNLVFESGKSSVQNYECGCPELIYLYDLLTKTSGVYGGRFSGAGFKGCCMALIDPDKSEEIENTVSTKYLKEFPALEGKYSFHLCDTADGVKL
jgi:galactokinase/galacturonokinase